VGWVVQDKIKTAKVVMGRAMQLQEHHMMQQREQEYNQALDQSMDDQRLQVPLPICPCQSALAHLPLLHLPLPLYPCRSTLAHLPLPICLCPSALAHLPFPIYHCTSTLAHLPLSYTVVKPSNLLQELQA